MKSFHWLKRLGIVIVGFILFYAPFALLARLSFWLTGKPKSLSTQSAGCGDTCLLHPVEWAFQPDSWMRFIDNPVLLTTFALIIIAFLFGPLFCGWMCPTGGVPEFLGKLIPNRFKLDLRAATEPSAIRYGFLVGFIATSLYGMHLSCAYCHYATFSDISIAFITLNFSNINHLTFSAGLITFTVWFVIFGLFTKGGRGWCNYVCPVGACQSLSHWMGSKLGFTYKMRFVPGKCSGCGTCEKTCPMWAIKMNSAEPKRNYHSCIGCRECKAACPNDAIIYAKGAEAMPQLLAPKVAHMVSRD